MTMTLLAAAADKQALLAAVERIRPVVEQGIEEGEACMTLPPATVNALTESGLFRIELPGIENGVLVVDFRRNFDPPAVPHCSQPDYRYTSQNGEVDSLCL